MTGASSSTRVRAVTHVERAATRRTLIALLASGLGILPLQSLFSDSGWLIDVWLTMIVVIGPAALIRLRREPGALDVWPGIVLLVPWLTLRFVHEHAVAGFLPTVTTREDVSALMTDLHQTTSHEVAPIHTTVAVELVLCTLLGLLAALVDLVAVVGRHGALAGVPLLVVYTVAGAVLRRPVSWVWFAFGAAAYLLLLALDSSDELQRWGRRVHATTTGRARSALSVSTPRIAVAAIAVAVVLPLFVPGDGRNLIANAFHGGGGGGGGGIGSFGGSGGGKLSPFAALKGELDRKTPTKLASVHVSSTGTVTPFYLRVNVLSDYTDAGWGVGSHGDTRSIGAGAEGYPTLPPDGSGTSVPVTAEITSTGFAGVNPPVFAVPDSISGLGSDTTWSAQDQLLLGSTLNNGDRYTVRFSQPEPSVAQLNRSTGDVGRSLRAQLAIPRGFPVYVQNLVKELTRGASTPFLKARALDSYFLDPANGFAYDLKVPVGDSGSALVDFLQGHRGFCQQYAAALAVMLRYAGVPARVVLGYMHQTPDERGNFTVTTADAHSWVEAYFAGLGWIPFDPTPAAGLADGGQNNLPWVQRPNGAGAGSTNDRPTPRPSAVKSTAGSSAPRSSAAAAPRGDAGSGRSSLPVWLLVALVVLVGIGLVPALVRSSRRRTRYLAARRDGDADALWAELSDTATDLGYVWSAARSPRQVAAWLADRTSESTHSLQSLVVAVEHRRYAPSSAVGAPPELVADLRKVTDELRSGRSTRTRLRAILWPASLGWPPLGSRRTH